MGRPVFVSGAPRSTSFGIVLAAYLAALAAAFVVALAMTSANPVFTVLAADTVSASHDARLACRRGRVTIAG